MNITRRNFLKIPLAASVAVALPVLAKADKPVFMGIDSGVDDRTVIGGFTLGSDNKAFKPTDIEGVHMWASGDNTTKMPNGEIRWNDMSGNGHHMYFKG